MQACCQFGVCVVKPKCRGKPHEDEFADLLLLGFLRGKIQLIDVGVAAATSTPRRCEVCTRAAARAHFRMRLRDAIRERHVEGAASCVAMSLITDPPLSPSYGKKPVRTLEAVTV